MSETVMFLLGGALGSVVTAATMALNCHLAAKTRATREQAVEDVVAEMEHYGHPWAPVHELRKKLPVPPTNFAWETQVITRTDGELRLQLALVDVATEENVSVTSVSLTRYRPHATNWSRYYRDYGTGSGGKDYVRKAFDLEILGPLVDWAVAERYKRQPPDPSYHIG